MMTDPELEAITAIETFTEAIGYLLMRGVSRADAVVLVQAVLAHADDPDWPRADH